MHIMFTHIFPLVADFIPLAAVAALQREHDDARRKTKTDAFLEQPGGVQRVVTASPHESNQTSVGNGLL